MTGWTETTEVQPIPEEKKKNKPFNLLPDDDYRFRLVKFELQPNAAKTDMKWSMEIQIIQPGVGKNRRIWPGISTKPGSAYMRQEFMHAMCPDLFNEANPWGPGCTIPPNLIGRTGLARVVIEPHFNNPNKLVNSVKRYFVDPEAVLPGAANVGDPLGLSGLSSPQTTTVGGFNPLV